MSSSTRRYTKSHEWIRVEGKIGTVGISDHAQAELTDVVFVELPAVGRTVDAGDPTAVVEFTDWARVSDKAWLA